MVDMKYCLNGAHVKCAIYAIQSKRSSNVRSDYFMKSKGK